MKRVRSAPRSTLHPAWCHCRTCRPPSPADLTLDQKVARLLAGLFVGQLLVIALDHTIGGPGPFVVFGI